MTFFLPKDTSGLIPRVLSQILDSCVNGVTLSDPDLEDMPIIYANKAFEAITGYTREEIVGRNCRFLQGNDRDQEGRHKIKEAIKNHEGVEVMLRNYRKNGELFYNRFNIMPLFDGNGKVIYYLGVQYDVTTQVQAKDEIKRLNSQIENLSSESV